jgi:hypothetical protein
LKEEIINSNNIVRSNDYSIWFIFPESILGGVPTLLINISKEFNRINLPFKIITPKNSYLYEKLKISENKFEFIDFNFFNNDVVKKKIQNNDILVIFNWYLELKHFVDINPRILFWNVFPDTYTRAIILPNAIRKIIDPVFLVRNLISLLIKKNGIVFMDSAPFQLSTNKYNINALSVNYLPIPITISTAKPLYSSTSRSITHHKLRIVYVGRSVIWKVHPAIRIIEDLQNISNDSLKVSLTIVTENQDAFSKIVSKYISHSSIDISYVNNITNDNLDDFLLNNCDLTITMGTACLESAKLGIPTIVVDASYSKIYNGYKYRWLFNSENFCLGNIITNKTEFKGFYLEEELPRVFLNDLFINEISYNCFKYVDRNHSIKNVAQDLINYCKISSLRHNDIRDKMFIYSKFGISLIQLRKKINNLYECRKR